MRFPAATQLANALLVCAGFLAISAGAQADILVPAGLQPGDQFRLFFTSAETMNAVATDVSVYDNFINGLADAAGLGAYNGASVSWHAIVSSDTVNAIDGLPVSNIAMYNLLGAEINTGNFWQGTFAGLLSVDEYGNASADLTEVWTGTTTGGTAAIDPRSGVDNTVGSSYVLIGEPFNGIAQFYLESAIVPETEQHSVYGYSDVITVGSRVPEPKPYTMMATFGVVLMMLRRRWAGQAMRVESPPMRQDEGK